MSQKYEMEEFVPFQYPMMSDMMYRMDDEAERKMVPQTKPIQQTKKKC
jgi:hypothetical protein